MKIIKVSVDEENSKYSITTQEGSTFYGRRALNAIRMINVGTDSKPLYEPHIDNASIKFLLQKKKQKR